MKSGDRVKWNSTSRGPLSKRKGTHRYVRKGEQGIVVERTQDPFTNLSQILWDNGFKSDINKDHFLSAGGRVINILDMLVDETERT